MKINRFGKAEVLSPDQINLLFTVGFVKPRDKALFGVCLYAACRINFLKPLRTNTQELIFHQ
jgi:integrase/recombinase XerD